MSGDGGRLMTFTGGDASPEARAERARRTRVLAFVRRAMAADGGDALVLLSDTAREPVGLFQLTKGADPEVVAQEVCAAIGEEADLSRATTFRLCVQSGDQTAASIQVRVRADAHADPLESHLKRPGESPEMALTRQLMRHNEGMARLLVESTERRAAADQKVFDRLATRLEQLETQRDRVDEQSTARMRVEAELVREMNADERRTQLERQALALLVPAMPRLLGKLLGENPQNPGVAASRSAPANSAEKAPEKPPAPEATPASAQNPMGGEVRASSPEEPPHMVSTPGDRVLSILRGMPPDAVEVMAEFLAGDGKAAEAAELRAAYAAQQKGNTK